MTIVTAMFKPRQDTLAPVPDLRDCVVEVETRHPKLEYQRSKPVQRGQKTTLPDQRLKWI